jgi:hypothetical protein
MRRNAAFGGVLWAVLVLASQAHFVRLTTIGLLFLLAPLVVAPMGLELCRRLIPGEPLGVSLHVARWLQFPAALCVVAAFWRRPGIAAATLALPWLCFGSVMGIAALRNLIRGDVKKLGAACVTMSFLYLPVGCAWLIASRLGISPMGFQEPIVLLTAVHFHFAGFAAPLLALGAESGIKTGNSVARRIFRVVAAGVLAGPGLLAAGFVIGPRVKLMAALLVACSEVALSLYFLAGIRTLRPHLAQVFVAASAISVLFAMILAAIWAIGEFPLQPFVHLDEMARFHGTANGIGFILCGLVGWTLGSSSKAREGRGTQ